MNRSPDHRARSPRDAAGAAERRLRELLEPTETAVRRVSRGALDLASPRRRRSHEVRFSGAVRSLSLTAGAVALLLAVALVFPQRSAGPPEDLRFPASRRAVTAPPRVTVVGSGRMLLVTPAIAPPSGPSRATGATVAASSGSGGSGSILLIRRRDS